MYSDNRDYQECFLELVKSYFGSLPEESLLYTLTHFLNALGLTKALAAAQEALAH